MYWFSLEETLSWGIGKRQTDAMNAMLEKKGKEGERKIFLEENERNVAESEQPLKKNWGEEAEKVL